MQITIHLDTADAADLAGLAALVASLGGRTVVTAPQTAHPRATSENLIEQEAKRAAGEHTGPTSGGTDSPQVDSSGLPWDERIHGKSGDGSKPMNADGTWRKRRGVDDTLVEQVKAELRGNVPVPPAPEVVAPAPTTAPPAPPATPDVADTASGPAAAETAPSAPPPPAANAARFAEYKDLVAAMNGKAGVTYASLNKHAADNFGLPAFLAVKDRPDMWGAFHDSFEA